MATPLQRAFRSWLVWLVLLVLVGLVSVTPRTQVYYYDCTDIRMLASIIDLRDMEAILEVYQVPEYRARRMMRCIDEPQRTKEVSK